MSFDCAVFEITAHALKLHSDPHDHLAVADAIGKSQVR